MKYDRLPTPANLLATLLILSLTQPCPLAQTQDASTSDTSKSWTAKSEPQLSGNLNPTRTSKTHTQGNGRTMDKQAVERIGPDGRYVPYLDTEKESVKVDATTVRTVERTFGRDPDGRKALIQVTEEERRSLPGGEVKVVRTTSNPDVNGGLQIVQREIRDTKQTTSAVQETRTTILIPNLNGGLAAAMQIQERETQSNDHTIQFRKSTLLPDGNGNWQLGEAREGVVKDDGKERTKEERVLRPGSDGRLSVVERTVSKKSETAAGEKRDTVETYSTDVPGSAGDGSLHLNQRVTTVHRARPDGGQATEEQVEQRNPGEPSADLRVTTKTIDIVRPAAGSTTQETQTIRSLDSSGSLGVVSVDTRKTDNPPAIQVDIAVPAEPK